MNSDEARTLFAAGLSAEWRRREEAEIAPILRLMDERIEKYRREAAVARGDMRVVTA